MESVASDTSGVYFTSSEGVSLTVEHEINDSWSFTGIFGYDEGVSYRPLNVTVGA